MRFTALDIYKPPLQTRTYLATIGANDALAVPGDAIESPPVSLCKIPLIFFSVRTMM